MAPRLLFQVSVLSKQWEEMTITQSKRNTDSLFALRSKQKMSAFLQIQTSVSAMLQINDFPTLFFYTASIVRREACINSGHLRARYAKKTIFFPPTFPFL